MSITVNLHDPTGFWARDFTSSPTNPFVTVRVMTADSTADIFLSTAEECDKLITAATEAKRLLLAVPLPHEPVAPRCDSQRVTPGNPLLQCSLEQDHQGLHAACTPTGVAIAEWDDEPEPPDPDACKCGHAGYQHVYTGHEPCTQCECKAFTAAPSGGVMFGPFTETAASLA